MALPASRPMMLITSSVSITYQYSLREANPLNVVYLAKYRRIAWVNVAPYSGWDSGGSAATD